MARAGEGPNPEAEADVDAASAFANIRSAVDRAEALTQSEEPSPGSGSLAEVAEGFRRDAVDATRRMWVMSVLAVLLVAVATAAVFVSGLLQDDTDPRLVGASVVGLLALAMGFLYLSSADRRDAAEARRMHRQLELLPRYLVDVASPVDQALRLALVQRLFPRLLGDDDPLRESEWNESTIQRLLDPSEM